MTVLMRQPLKRFNKQPLQTNPLHSCPLNKWDTDSTIYCRHFCAHDKRLLLLSLHMSTLGAPVPANFSLVFPIVSSLQFRPPSVPVTIAINRIGRQYFTIHFIIKGDTQSNTVPFVTYLRNSPSNFFAPAYILPY